MAKYVLITEDLTDAQAENFIKHVKGSMPGLLGWTLHKMLGEDIPESRDGHLLHVTFAETGNPPKGT